MARPARSSPVYSEYSSSTCPRWCPRSPAPSARRTGSCWPTPSRLPRRAAATTCRDTWTTSLAEPFPASDSGAAGAQRQPRTRPWSPLADGTTYEIDHGAVVIAADHLLHQHLQPLGDGRRRPAGQEGRGEGPARQALGEDHAGPRFQGGHGLLRAGRADCPTWTSSASTWSATAAPPASATPGPLTARDLPGGQRARPGGASGALRQPELRGPDQPGREDELPGLAAAGGRLRDRRHDGHRPGPRAARHRTPRARPVYLADIWPSPAGGRRRGRSAVGPGDVRQGLRRRLRRRRPLAVR